MTHGIMTVVCLETYGFTLIPQIELREKRTLWIMTYGSHRDNNGYFADNLVASTLMVHVRRLHFLQKKRGAQRDEYLMRLKLATYS